MVRETLLRITSAIALCVAAGCILMVVFANLALLQALRKLSAPFSELMKPHGRVTSRTSF